MTTDIFEYQPGPLDNPLRGLVPFHATGHHPSWPHSLEFGYITLDTMFDDQGKVNTLPLETLLENIASHGCQAVIRLVIDYPGETSGIPRYLTKAGLQSTRYAEHGGGLSPDYADKRLIEAMEQLIAAIGKVYDGDPRLGFIEAGLLGFWGEWHTWPRNELAPPLATEERVIKAYASAFRLTPVLLRRTGGKGSLAGFGFHDDSFGLTTLEGESWHFLTDLKSAGLGDIWKTRPIGGELRPELQPHVLAGTSSIDPPMQDMAACLEKAHPTFLLFEQVFSRSLDKDETLRAQSFASRLGYELQATQGSCHYEGERVRLSLTLTNRGVAPFYAPWKFKARFLDAQEQVIGRTINLSWTPQGLLPGAVKSFTHLAAKAPAETAFVEFIIENPLPNGKPLRLANAGSGTEGWFRIPLSSS
ncbi:MAG: hypothetical protein AB7F75_01665 [Planctomycetota bacterium]